MAMEVPFKTVNMGKGSIAKIMPKVKAAAGLLGAIKGHSVRKTFSWRATHLRTH